mgnify:CR=1 FL=1
MATDPEILAHKHWLGYVQPVGLVVSIPALLNAQCYINSNVIPDHQRFLANVDLRAEPPTIKDFPTFVRDVFEWDAADLVKDIPASLEVPLPEYGETLAPTYAVKEFKPAEGKSPWLLLVKELPIGQSFDDVATADDRRWQASPHSQFERLLRETQVPVGLLVNGTHMRLVYAPRGENSGYATFRVADMTQVSGRPIFAALFMLLSVERLFAPCPEKQRLPAILEASRKYQSIVSTKLAEQVLAALYELLRGFQAADEARKSDLLTEVLKHDPDHVYNGLLTVLMRLVFVLYAEDRGLLSSDPLYSNHYSVTGLFERLRADAGKHLDTMDQRYGAWSQLLTLFRLIFDGAQELKLPPRQGYLFDPDRYNFLEGRAWKQRRTPPENGIREKLRVPRLSDGVIFRVLTNLLVLDGERLSYRTLDVEQVGSVYETMMGFNVEVAAGRSIAIKPAKSHGAPTAVNLEALLAIKPADRAKWLKENADQSLTGQAADALKTADTVEDLLAALEKKIAKNATPNVVSAGSMVLQPSDERRKSGSHYTPRSLTEPIVRKTLEPILKRFGDHPTPQQLLDLKVCDPAMGSGAFLVEVCRQLGDELVRAWHHHKQLPKIPPDEDEILHARRIIAQRCLYGVDRNPMAVDLAKLSLWLATLAKDHPFTFLDHTLRHGDSLVGLTRQQIGAFHWLPTNERQFGQEHIARRIEEATRYRKEILDAGDNILPAIKSQKLAVADDQLNGVRFFGDLVIAAFFSAEKDKARKEKRNELLAGVTAYLHAGDFHVRPKEAEQLRIGKHPLWPFHWEIEYPEVFTRQNGGFDAMVGNPPFAGGRNLSASAGERYSDWITTVNVDASGGADLVAFFFLRAFNALGVGGTFGLIATNTIGQGDTRATGLRRICTNGGTIYAARKRYRWPGAAAVVVSVVHVIKGSHRGPLELDGREVPIITAYLFHSGGHEDPIRLRANDGKSFQGDIVLGMGFTFDDTNKNGDANSLESMRLLIERDPRNGECIYPYIGGEEVNDDPRQLHHRFVVNLGEMLENDVKDGWPDLYALIEDKVKPERITKDAKKYPRMVHEWWKFWNHRVELYDAIRPLQRVLAISRVSRTGAFTFLPSGMVYSLDLIVFALDETGFGVLQSRVHDTWIRFAGSSMKDDLRYSPTDCFQTFPFPNAFESDRQISSVALEYYDFRADLMIRNNEGLTKTYNRFHDPDERSADILKLRELHAAMDRAVLDAYRWTDIPTDCQFLLDYEEDESEDTDIQLSPKRGKGKKKPWRHRWPDEVRDEVLARLLALNAERAKAEKESAASAKASSRTKGTTKAQRSDSVTMFDTE